MGSKSRELSKRPQGAYVVKQSRAKALREGAIPREAPVEELSSSEVEFLLLVE